MVTSLRGELDYMVRLLHHHQGFPYMPRLPSTLFAALFSQTLGFAYRLLETVARRWLTTIVTVLACLSFQFLDTGVRLLNTFQGFGKRVAQGLIFGYLSSQFLDDGVRLFNTFQGFGKRFVQGLIFGSLRFQFSHQFFNVHEDTLPNFFLALNPFGAFVFKGGKEA